MYIIVVGAGNIGFPLIDVATMAAMVSTLALAFFFIKYGGDYETPE